MTAALAFLLIVATLIYVRYLFAWWPVLDDPEYFHRLEDADNTWHVELRRINAEGQINKEARL